MESRCPKCGAEDAHMCIEGHLDGLRRESRYCILRQLAAANETIKELIRDKDSAGMAWRAYRDYPKPGTIAEVELGNYFAGMGED